MDAFAKILTSSLNKLNEVLWGHCLIYLLIAAGLYFSLRLRFIQVFDFKHILETMFASRKHPKGEISSFQSFCTGLGARVGSGNVAGVAVAIHLGGPGAIFWMWVIAFLGMATGFIEGTLAQLYKEKSEAGPFIGGPAYYITKGLGRPKLATTFALLLILSFGLIFNAVQANTLVAAAHKAFHIDKYILGVLLCFATLYVINGGIVRVSHASEVLVPIMAFLYIALALILILVNLNQMPMIFSSIIKHAFGYQSAGSGLIGYSFIIAAENGIKRGLFSNEAGMGSAANAAATASPLPKHPVSQGYIQMFSVFIDTVVICTITAFIILLADPSLIKAKLTGINLAQAALAQHIGASGPIILAILLFFFAYTSIAANYSYAESNLLYLSKSKTLLNIFRLAMIAMVFFGSLSKVSLVWMLADSAMGFMALINLTALILLSNVAFKAAKDYRKKRKKGLSMDYRSDAFDAWR